MDILSTRGRGAARGDFVISPDFESLPLKSSISGRLRREKSGGYLQEKEDYSANSGSDLSISFILKKI